MLNSGNYVVTLIFFISFNTNVICRISKYNKILLNLYIFSNNSDIVNSGGVARYWNNLNINKLRLTMKLWYSCHYNFISTELFLILMLAERHLSCYTESRSRAPPMIV